MYNIFFSLLFAEKSPDPHFLKDQGISRVFVSGRWDGNSGGYCRYIHDGSSFDIQCFSSKKLYAFTKVFCHPGLLPRTKYSFVCYYYMVMYS